MSERLDAGNHFDTQLCCVGIDLLQLFGRVGAALVAKIGLPWQRVGILRVEHNHVVAQQGQTA